MLRSRWMFLAAPALMLVSFAALGQGTHSVVDVPVANMFSGPSANVDVVSQAIYSSTVDVLEEKPGWDEIRTRDDGYTGWVPHADLVAPPSQTVAYAAAGEVAVINELAAHLYLDPDLTLRAPLLTVPFETRLEVVQKNPGGRWLQVRLPDGRTAWVQHGDVLLYQNGTNIPRNNMSVPEMVEFSRRFLGLPYTWGGRSSFGYDCSGFVQMLMRQRGYSIPRDADVQAKWSGFEPIGVSQLRAGDVLFFGGRGKITHTGMYIGDGKFINATTHEHPIIQISPLDEYWRGLLVAQRRVKQ